ncbi:MAG: Gfo/Idh/MocA family oxidoreductase [Pontiellaceae bacterium]|nr:Gfo/Idh/MocA family oxidoreductase [Pontiellaceae bacterium]MBN2783699.1 Gfo/Idh/MocA family oxidoreductase [Pontiellaceae bacterium]
MTQRDHRKVIRLKRRGFLGVSGLGMVAPLVLPGRVLGSDRPSNQIRMAAIGCGRMGRGNITNLFNQGLKMQARFVAVCDLDLKRARAAKTLLQEMHKEHDDGRDISKEITVDQDYREVLGRPDVDAVLISTPDHWHAQIAIEAARAGKDIYLEKPLTYTLREGQSLIQAVRQNKVVLQTGTHQRSMTYFRRVCELVRQGRIGAIQKVLVSLPMDPPSVVPYVDMKVPDEFDYKRWVGSRPWHPYTEAGVHPQNGFSRPGWMQVEDFALGMITNWGTHMNDIAQWGLGMERSGPVSFTAQAEFPDDGIFDVHGSFNAQVKYENGVELVMQSGSPGVRFEGADGWLFCSREKMEAHQREILRETFTPEQRKLQYSTNHHADFLQSIRSRKDPVAPVEAAHRSNSLCILTHIAMKTGRTLQWDPANEDFVNDPDASSML